MPKQLSIEKNDIYDMKTTSVKDKANYKHSTFNGHRLYLREERFIDAYMRTGNIATAYIEAGYTGKSPSQAGKNILKKSYIMEEINHRTELMKQAGIADSTEVMEYLTRVMRGEVADQFGLAAPLSERTNAAKEIQKHYDLVAKEENKKNAEITVILDWERPEPVKIEDTDE